MLKGQVEKQADYVPRSAGKREPTLTPLQEASLKAALVKRYFPALWEEEGVSPKVIAREGPEALRNMIAALDNVLFGPKDQLDAMVSRAKRERKQLEFESGP